MTRNGRDMWGASLQERFDKFVPNKPLGSCWLWAGGLSKGGYGTVCVDYKSRRATHVALELDGRPMPFDGAFALHSCDNPQCVNPTHLRWGTAKDNINDVDLRGRRPPLKLACRQGHLYSEFGLVEATSGRRRCVKCRDAQPCRLSARRA